MLSHPPALRVAVCHQLTLPKRALGVVVLRVQPPIDPDVAAEAAARGAIADASDGDAKGDDGSDDGMEDGSDGPGRDARPETPPNG